MSTWVHKMFTVLRRVGHAPPIPDRTLDIEMTDIDQRMEQQDKRLEKVEREAQDIFNRLRLLEIQGDPRGDRRG